MTTIIRYQNRKLYNKETAKYVTLSEVLKLGFENVTVIDHVTKENITNNVLINAVSSHLQKNPTLFETLKPTLSATIAQSVADIVKA